MTLRDWFAAMAIPTLLGHRLNDPNPLIREHPGNKAELARRAYDLADALLEERARRDAHTMNDVLSVRVDASNDA